MSNIALKLCFLMSWSTFFLLLFSQLSYAGSVNQSPISNNQKEEYLKIQQTLYLEAEKSLQSSKFNRFKEQLKQLDKHPLKQYLIRDELLLELQNKPISNKTKKEITEFLTGYSNQVVSRQLRYYWLSYLLETRQNEEFLNFYRPTSSLKLRCHSLYLRLKRDGMIEDITQQIENVWLTGKSIPKHCDRMIAKWQKMGGLSDLLIWERMKLAVENKSYSLANYLNRMRAHQQQNTGQLLIKLYRRPHVIKSLSTKQISSQYHQDALLVSLNRLAWLDPNKAIVEWKRFSQSLKLSDQQLKILKRSIALSLAISADKNARDWLVSIDKGTDDSVQQWLLSSTLNLNDWALIENTIINKIPKSSISDRWKYWRAISILKNGNLHVAQSMLESLAKKRSYYGFLAANQLNLEPALNFKKIAFEQDRFEEISKAPHAQRALALYQLGRLTQARKEWNKLQKNFSSKEYTISAYLAHQWGWNHQAILAFAKSRQIDDIEKRFPLYSKSDYEFTSEQHKIPMSWAYAITRQESAFRADATSSAGAQGLMQLKPSTARGVARKQSKTSQFSKLSRHQIARRNLLLQPKLNIQLGIAHLKEMLVYYNGNPILATAAYNAGPNRVDSWLRDNQISNSIQWIEQIPYKETREYVKNVLTYQEIYSQIAATDDSYFRNLEDFEIPTDIKTSAQISTR